MREANTDSQANTDNTVITEVRGAVLVMTIDRPQAHNSVNPAVAEELTAHLAGPLTRVRSR